jgi:hypothetical protein
LAPTRFRGRSPTLRNRPCVASARIECAPAFASRAPPRRAMCPRCAAAPLELAPKVVCSGRRCSSRSDPRVRKIAPPAKSWRVTTSSIALRMVGTCGQEEHFIGIAIELAQGEAAATGQPTLSRCSK